MSREKSRDICLLQNINTCDKLHKKNRKLNSPSTEAPRIDTLRTILAALGCSLSITALETVDTHIEIAADAPIGTAIQPQA